MSRRDLTGLVGEVVAALVVCSIVALAAAGFAWALRVLADSLAALI